MNEGVFGCFGKVLQEEDDRLAFNEVPLLSKVNAVAIRSDLYGPTGSDLDVVGTELLLEEMEVGDWAVVKDMGADAMTAANPAIFAPIPAPTELWNEEDEEDDFQQYW